MKRSELRKIIQEEVRKFLVETGEPDQDYDHDVYDAIVEEIKHLGYEAYHREFDKYQSVYIQIQGVDRFWFDDVSSRGNDMLFTIFPATDPDMKFQGSVYEFDEGEWIATFEPKFKEYLDGLKTKKGHREKSKRLSDLAQKQEDEDRHAEEQYEKSIPKLSNPHLKGKHLVIITAYGDTYRIDEWGRIAKENMQPSGGWFLLGITPVNVSGFQIKYKFNDISQELIDGLALAYKNKNPKFTVVDWDHGSERIWGNTKTHGIKNMYIE